MQNTLFFIEDDGNVREAAHGTSPSVNFGELLGAAL